MWRSLNVVVVVVVVVTVVVGVVVVVVVVVVIFVVFRYHFHFDVAKFLIICPLDFSFGSTIVRLLNNCTSTSQLKT